MITWNSNGFSTDRLDIHAAHIKLAQYDVVAVLDTRGNTLLDACMTQTHVVHHYKCEEHSPGTGMSIYVANRIAGVCRFAGFHKELLLGWVECGAVQLGFVYVPPSKIQRVRDRTGVLVKVTEAVAERQRRGPVVITGDWNAKIGTLEDDIDDPREVPLVWHKGVLNHDAFGVEVLECTQRLGLKTATGRLDQSQPTWARGHVREGTGEGQGEDPGVQRSRLDHAFIQSDIWDQIREYAVLHDRMGSDHNAISMVVNVRGVRRATKFASQYRWDPTKKESYLWELYFGLGGALLLEAEEAAERGEIEMAAAKLREAIEKSATKIGLERSRAGGVPDRKSGGHRGHLPLTREEMRYKREIKKLIKEGKQVPQELRHLWRRAVKRARQAKQEAFRNRMRDHLFNNPRIFWKKYKLECGEGSSADALFTTAEWTEHFKVYFRVEEGRQQPSGHQQVFMEDSCPLTGEFTQREVEAVCKKMGTGKAVGPDAIPIELYTKAKCPEYGGPQVMRVIAMMFNAVLKSGEFPREWKCTHIVPLYKKGGKTDMGNYRPIGVSTTLCRMFSGIIATRMSSYTHRDPQATRLQPSQFGFRPELSTDHAHLILTTCVDSALALGKPMALVRLDISKAYDRVDRNELWASMARDGFPQKFTELMRELYRDTDYVVRVNGELGDAFSTFEGLLQGRGPSPGQFNTYERETIEEIDRECAGMGIKFEAQVPVSCVQATWADDISCTVQLDDLARFMQIVIRVLSKKKMQLNMQKCECVIIGLAEGQECELAGLRRVPESKVLGLWYCESGRHDKTMADRREKGKSKNVLHVSRLTRSGCERDIEVARLMVKVDISPTLLFGAPIWGANQLIHRDPSSHPMQSVMSVLTRFALGLPAGTAHWTVTNLSGVMPVMHQILMLFIKFWNRAMDVMEWNPLVQGALSQQQFMYVTTRKACWLRRWVHVWSVVDPRGMSKYCLQNLQPIDEHIVEGMLHNKWDRLLDGYGNPFSIRPCGKRKVAYTHKVLGPHRVWGELPEMVRVHWPVHLKVEWWQFLGGHAVTDFRGYQWLRESQFHERICDRCQQGKVGDERHILLDCTLTAGLRDEYRTRLRWARTLPTLIHYNCKDRTFIHFIRECLRVYRRGGLEGEDQ